MDTQKQTRMTTQERNAIEERVAERISRITRRDLLNTLWGLGIGIGVGTITVLGVGYGLSKITERGKQRYQEQREQEISYRNVGTVPRVVQQGDSYEKIASELKAKYPLRLGNVDRDELTLYISHDLNKSEGLEPGKKVNIPDFSRKSVNKTENTK